MTYPLFQDDAYLQSAAGVIVEVDDKGGIILDQTVFYPTGGGQPGDKGQLSIGGSAIDIVSAVNGQGGRIVLLPAANSVLPQIGDQVNQKLDWQQRYRFMRVHTALHLLSVVLPFPVTGGQIGIEKGRLDFDMPDAPEDKQAIEDQLNALIAQDLEISESWISDSELEARPEMVKTMSVKPPVGSGRVRLVRIGSSENQIDLQPCGGTHVKRTSEIGQMRLGKIEKKSRLNRRVNIHLTS